MSTNGEYILIDAIAFESGDTTAVLTGQLHQGNLSYNSEIIISQSHVNLVINELQKVNVDHCVGDLFQSFPMFDEGLMYTANFDGLESRKIDLNGLLQLESIREIRA